MATKKIAEWVHGLTPDKIPEAVKEAAVKSFVNYVGCAIGGVKHEATQNLIEAHKGLEAVGRVQVCSLLGHAGKADPLQAALANAFSAHLHDYDDTHLSTIIHPTAAVASALLAYVEWTSSGEGVFSGEDFICALVAGMEVECILGTAVYPSHYDLGWHITATVGSIGATIAVAKAMRLGTDKLVNAVGLGAAQVSGMRRHFGSHAKPLGVAFAAQSGLQAAIFARQGMTAADDALEGKRGWIECVCPKSEDAKRKLDEFMGRLYTSKGIDSDGIWEIQKNTFKPFPCGIVIHPAIDGCVQLRSEGLSADNVTSMEMIVHPLVLELTGKQFPKYGLEAKFSVYHGAACGLQFGKATPAQYTDEVVKETAKLREKITAIVDESIRPDECRIVVTTSTGRVQKHVEHAVGSLSKPLTSAHLRQKFEDQVSPQYGAQRSTQLFEDLMNIRDRGNMVGVLVDI